MIQGFDDFYWFVQGLFYGLGIIIQEYIDMEFYEEVEHWVTQASCILKTIEQDYKQEN